MLESTLEPKLAKEMLHSYYINCSDTKKDYKKYCETKDALNLRLKQLFQVGYFKLNTHQ